MRDKVKVLLDRALEENSELFLIDFEIKSGNNIAVVIDGDKGVSVEDCIAVSRAIEHNLDREEEDFSLEVTSAGVGSLLSLPRQYKKNIGRRLYVKTADEVYEATLIAADDAAIQLAWKAREPKPVGKGKVTVKKEITLPYETIAEAKVVITF
ncbi:ribosome maturation factor RimP [Mesonia hippocampi]|uniref:Ribosome maturation factor RimP n=1 Tax=Mesonia hippocampi TaxID=1628250 RepID=A0A840EX68_9FLAO|nr:ribosome assembly cofactor RimP [Mesonia hippocampi]MBB4119427.1 ribosome maturation factor RimP [Mesonia hippocampi]